VKRAVPDSSTECEIIPQKSRATQLLEHSKLHAPCRFALG